MTPADFEPPMTAALEKYGINPKMPKGRDIIRQHWNAFRGYRADPWSKALASAVKKHTNFFPTPNQVSAVLDLFVPPAAKPKVEEPEVEPTREEYEAAIKYFEANGLKGMAAGCRKRLEAMK